VLAYIEAQQVGFVAEAVKAGLSKERVADFLARENVSDYEVKNLQYLLQTSEMSQSE
jgi:predicted transcriptional regulator